MSYSDGFGRAPRHNAPPHQVPRHNEHGARRSHANIERPITQYEDLIRGEPSERNHKSLRSARGVRPHRGSTHTDTTECKRIGRGFPNEYDVDSYQQHLILMNHRGYDRDDEPEFA